MKKRKKKKHFEHLAITDVTPIYTDVSRDVFADIERSVCRWSPWIRATRNHTVAGVRLWLLAIGFDKNDNAHLSAEKFLVVPKKKKKRRRRRRGI